MVSIPGGSTDTGAAGPTRDRRQESAWPAGAAERGLELRGEAQRIVASSAGRPTSCTDTGRPSASRPARQRDRGLAGHVPRRRERDDAAAARSIPLKSSSPMIFSPTGGGAAASVGVRSTSYVVEERDDPTRLRLQHAQRLRELGRGRGAARSDERPVGRSSVSSGGRSGRAASALAGMSAEDARSSRGRRGLDQLVPVGFERGDGGEHRVAPGVARSSTSGSGCASSTRCGAVPVGAPTSARNGRAGGGAHHASPGAGPAIDVEQGGGVGDGARDRPGRRVPGSAGRAPT